MEKLLQSLPTWALVVIIVLLISLVIALMKLGVAMLKKLFNDAVERLETRFDKIDDGLDGLALNQEAQDMALDEILPANGTGYMKKKEECYNTLLEKRIKEKELYA